MPTKKSGLNIRSVHADRDAILGDQIIYGYSAEEVRVLFEGILAQVQPKPFDGKCPYPGLSAFDEQDADHFFGREQLVEELLERIKKSQAIFIVGPSGSGKSSLVRAGLIPALKNGVINGSENWLYIHFTPAQDPIEQLALSIGRATQSPHYGDYFREHADNPDALDTLLKTILPERPNQRALIFVDQFEEFFTLGDRNNQQQFLNLLFQTINAKDSRVAIILAMRSDFVSNCAGYPDLNALLNKQFFQVGAMQPDELIRAISLPALHAGLKIEPGLIHQIIHDMENEPGVLPLMQFALRDLFETRQQAGGLISLTQADYLKRGGIHKALKRHADAEFKKLAVNEKKIAEEIFKSLVNAGADSRDTRRIARYDDLTSSEMRIEQIEAVVHKLANARLLTTDEKNGSERTLTLAHEKLIEAWPWLKDLVNQNRELIQIRNQIIEDAIEWEREGKNESYLYTGAKFTVITRKLKSSPIGNEKTEEFLQACLSAHQRRTRRSVLVAGIIIAMAFVFAYTQIRPYLIPQLRWKEADVGGAGVTTFEIMPNGTLYAGMYNQNLKNNKAPTCLVRGEIGSNTWEPLGPACANGLVNSLFTEHTSPDFVYFFSSTDGLFRLTVSTNESEKIDQDLTSLKSIDALSQAPDGTLFAGDFDQPGLFKRRTQDYTWEHVKNSPASAILVLTWEPEGLLAGTNDGLYLWQDLKEWKLLVPNAKIQTVARTSKEKFALLAGGPDGVFLSTEGNPSQSAKKAEHNVTSMAVVYEPEPYVLALTDKGKIIKLTTGGEQIEVLDDLDSNYAFVIRIQNDDPLRIWIGTAEGLHYGEMRPPILDISVFK